MKSIHYPLSCLIDDGGWRLLAQTFLPIQHLDTLVYGSADGGKTVVSHPIVVPEMTKLARVLNLASHKVKRESNNLDDPIDLHLPADCEGMFHVHIVRIAC